MKTDTQKRQAVEKLYDTYPFPPEQLLDEPPPGYNWRWHWVAAYSFCTGQKPAPSHVRILDAGCGTGVGTEYLLKLNPEAEVVGIDLSREALAIAQERCQRSGVAQNRSAPVEFHQLKLEEVEQLPGEFDLINCVGVLHHLPNPQQGIQALAKKLAPGGLMHIFVYAELGRWEIQLMQKAIALLQGEPRQDYREGVKIGRQLFAHLPENNRLVIREKERWSLENQRDECFADMYVHPQEIDYNIETLFELIDSSSLKFIGFSNPNYWQLERLLATAPELITRANQLDERARYRLIELLDPSLTHYEFFLGRSPLINNNWLDDEALLAALVELNPCLEGFPSRSLFNHDYQLVKLSEVEFNFLQLCNSQTPMTVREVIAQVPLDLSQVRSLQKQQLIILTPNPDG